MNTGDMRNSKRQSHKSKGKHTYTGRSSWVSVVLVCFPCLQRDNVCNNPQPWKVGVEGKIGLFLTFGCHSCESHHGSGIVRSNHAELIHRKFLEAEIYVHFSDVSDYLAVLQNHRLT